MKKKLLTVLLAVVMVFGVFGMTACSGKANPADDYNYYSSVYSSLKDEEDIRIHSVVYLALEMMAKTSNSYLIWTGGAWDSNANAMAKAVNDVAKKFDVEVYNLDLRLDGGLSLGKSEAAPKYYSEYLSTEHTATISTKVEYVQATDKDGNKLWEMQEIDGKKVYKFDAEGKKIPVKAQKVDEDGNLVWEMVKDANGKDTTEYAKDADGHLIPVYQTITTKVTKTTYTKQATAVKYEEALYLNTADDKLATMSTRVKAYKDQLRSWGFVEGEDDETTKTIDERTIPQNALIGVAGNGSKLSVKFIAKTAADLETCVYKTAFANPSAMKPLDGKIDPAGFNTSAIKAFDYFGDNRLHMGEEEGVDQFDGVDSVYEVITLHAFIDILKNCKGDFSVFFGGAWCPNTQAIATLTNDVAKGMGVSRVFFFDPNLDGSSSKGGLNTRTSNTNAPEFELNADGSYKLSNNKQVPKKDSDGNVITDETQPWYNYRSASSFGSGLTEKNFQASGLYALLVDTIAAGGQAYKSYWNDPFRTANHTLWINGTEYSRMCVPNIMAFKAQEGKSAKLVNWKEAEYYWANTSVEGDPAREGWWNASIEIMEENDYSSAYVAPIVVEEAPAASAGSSSSAPAAGGAAEAC